MRAVVRGRGASAATNYSNNNNIYNTSPEPMLSNYENEHNTDWGRGDAIFCMS